ncbi:hypothetical protein LSAT2_026929 [Lamellibrachia satsuma]|nr:hypothetical protein LSAT2_026929 [Lamellibrachia satsuma]
MLSVLETLGFPCLFYPPPFPPIFPIHALMLSVLEALGLPCFFYPPPFPPIFPFHALMLSVLEALGLPCLFYPLPFPPIFPIHALMLCVLEALGLPCLFYPQPFPPIFPIEFLPVLWWKPIGETVLYFGCRHKNEDFIYSDELAAYVSDGTLTHMHVAFSRDQPQKVYVQHLLKETAAQVWRLIDAGAHIYVCGDARHMAHDVDEVLLDTVVSEGKLDRAAAQDYLKRLRSRGRYSCDIWS